MRPRVLSPGEVVRSPITGNEAVVLYVRSGVYVRDLQTHDVYRLEPGEVRAA